MRSQGFDGAGIRKVISGDPRYLCCNVEKNLTPKFQFLRDLGLSESDIVDVIRNNNEILCRNVHRSFVPRLELWESILGSRELVLKHLKKTGWFFFPSVEKTLHPNLKFLRDECGIPEERLSLVLRSHPQLISQKPDSLRALVARADELGMPRQSRMFMWTLNILQRVSRERFEAKVELMSISVQLLQWSLKEQLHWADQESPALVLTLLLGCMDFSQSIKTLSMLS
uniref:Mitochondrial transcription termination factor family protein n=1 Tax=Musa acuminata subsp. malaccensis TaxID=214687 RepID=A0A804KZS1_MUSAM